MPRTTTVTSPRRVTQPTTSAPVPAKPSEAQAWPQSGDDFSDEEATRARDKHVSPRATTVPPPIPTKPVVVRAEPSPDFIGDWQIMSVLGRGATATVYAATHREFGKRAALKLSRAPLDSGELGAKVFAREARVVHLVDHPGMPDVFATGMHEGRPYLVMERLTGETLKQRLARGSSDTLQALDLLIDICDVLAAAHKEQIVHRDLKLDNVLVLLRPGAGCRVKVIDWAFSCVLGEEDPLHGMVAGALNYVAPEQVRGQPITTATDIYSLGVIAYRLVLGEKPFAGGDDVELVQRHLFTAPADPTLLWPKIPNSLARVMVKMLAKDPAVRPPLPEVRAQLCAAREACRRPSLWPRAIGAVIALACIGAGAAALVAS